MSKVVIVVDTKKRNIKFIVGGEGVELTNMVYADCGELLSGVVNNEAKDKIIELFNT